MRLQHRSERGLSQFALLTVVGSVALGGAIGVGARLATVEGSRATFALTPVAYATCPEGVEIGQFHRGDRVLSTGRDASGDWLEVRDPGELGGRVWVEAQFVVADGATGGLPVRECAASSTAPTTSTTQPAFPGVPGTGGGPGGTGGPPATDTTGPTIGAIGASQAEIWEFASGLNSPCNTIEKTRTMLSVSISDPSGVAGATHAWSFPGHSGGDGLAASGGSWQIGPFDYGTIANNTVATITVTVTAQDARGNSSSASRTVALHSASECIG